MSRASWPHPAAAAAWRAAPSSALVTARRVLALALAAALLGGCATRPGSLPPAGSLLHDGLFAAPAEPVDAGTVFAISPPMRQFADAVRHAARGPVDLRHALVQALRTGDQLQLDYDDGRTRNAAEAFDKRAGNCLSLVLMTAAFAKYLDLPLRYQSVQVRPLYTRAPDLTLASGHINVVLSGRGGPMHRELVRADELTVDFVPPEDLRGASVRPLAERTVVAMYMNNRAAETLAAGQHAQAYAWAREALHHDPDYLPGINTLAVIYLRAGHVAEAGAALRHVLAYAPRRASPPPCPPTTPKAGPRGLEWVRARVGMKAAETLVHLRHEQPVKMKGMVPRHVRQLVQRCGLQATPEERPATPNPKA